ncbi:SHCBP1 family protein [Megaselia abdita]
MEVFEFEKNLLTRLQDVRDVLCWKDEGISSARVKYEWKYFMEIQCETTGWQALWKIPRIICEEMSLRYPTVVFGMVENVIFNDLKATFFVQAVQDDNVHMPEKQEVNLIDLYPTKDQENKEINTERTAEVLDSLRFFYQNIWMPWDNDIDDDFDWAEKHLESRIRFYYDLKKKDMRRPLATQIRTLLAEAKYIQERREYIEIGLNSTGDNLEDTISQSEKADLMRIHLRLSMIKSEMDILENPETRSIYEECKLESQEESRECISYIVTSPDSNENQIMYLQKVQQFLKDPNGKVQMCNSFQKAIELCNALDEIFLPPGEHSIKFLDFLNDNGTVTGIGNAGDVILKSPDDESILLIFEGNFKLKNVTLDCSNVRNGIVLKKGNVILDSCVLFGDGKSSTQQGVLCNGNSKLLLKNCVIKKFATGVVLKGLSEFMMKRSTVKNCTVGIEPSDESTVALENCTIEDCQEFGISWETSLFNSSNCKTKFEDLSELRKNVPSKSNWLGECNFLSCKKGNIVLFGKSQINIQSIEKNISVDETFHSLIETEESSEDNIGDSGNEDNSHKSTTTKNARNMADSSDCSIYLIEDSLIED